MPKNYQGDFCNFIWELRYRVPGQAKPSKVCKMSVALDVAPGGFCIFQPTKNEN